MASQNPMKIQSGVPVETVACHWDMRNCINIYIYIYIFLLETVCSINLWNLSRWVTLRITLNHTAPFYYPWTDLSRLSHCGLTFLRHCKVAFARLLYRLVFQHIFITQILRLWNRETKCFQFLRNDCSAVCEIIGQFFTKFFTLSHLVCTLQAIIKRTVILVTYIYCNLYIFLLELWYYLFVYRRIKHIGKQKYRKLYTTVVRG